MSEPLKFKSRSEGPPRKPIPLNERDQRTWDILAADTDDAVMLAVQFDVSQQTIRNVKMIKTDQAKRIEGLMLHLGHKPHTWEPARRFTNKEVAAIRANTKASHVIAKEYGCSPSTIRMIKSGQTYGGA